MLKRIYCLLFFFLMFGSIHAQIGGEDEVYLNGDKIEAKFQGGNLNTFLDFVSANFDKTKIKKEGQLIFSFTVNEEGEVKNISIVKDLGVESAVEMIRVLQLSPKWQPAMRNGKPFATTYKVPFTYKWKNQNVSKLNDTADLDEKVYISVEKPAEFPGGSKAFMDFFVANFKNPVKIEREVKAFLEFIVNKDGSLSEVKILRLNGIEDNGLLRDELIRVTSASPKWIPGMQKGEKIRMKFIQPIILKLTNK